MKSKSSELMRAIRAAPLPDTPSAKPPIFVQTPKGERMLIGVAERIDLPVWGIFGLRAKIDTGARSSALHVEGLDVIDGDRVRFTVNKGLDTQAWVTATFSRRAVVRSSSGAEQQRYFVTTTLRLGQFSRDVEISLTSRDSMRYPMLLGRTAMRSALIIDPTRRYVATPLNLPGDKPLKKSSRTPSAQKS